MITARNGEILKTPHGLFNDHQAQMSFSDFVRITTGVRSSIGQFSHRLLTSKTLVWGDLPLPLTSPEVIRISMSKGIVRGKNSTTSCIHHERRPSPRATPTSKNTNGEAQEVHERKSL